MRNTYPIPPGYRMLQPGEVIKENDQSWQGTGFKTVPHVPAFTGRVDERHKATCIIRAASVLPCAYCRITIDPVDILLWGDLAFCSYVHAISFFQNGAPPCHEHNTDKWCDHEGQGGFMGHTCYFHCEGCGKPMGTGLNFGLAIHRVACSQFCTEALLNPDVPVIDTLDQQPIEMRADQIRPDYYKQGGIEVISIIRVFKLGFNLGNVLKYILRAGLKTTDRLKDLQKANTYLQFELGEEHEKTTNN